MKLFKRSEQGVAAIEFAILLPFLLIVLYGTFQVSNYIMATRKVDSFANDIAYILSREGNIADRTYDPVSDSFYYVGGNSKIQNIVDSLGYMVLYPYPYEVATRRTGTTSVQVRYVGLPIFTPSAIGNACNGDTINRTIPRVMWEFNTTSAEAGAGVAQEFDLVFHPCTNDLCPNACDGNKYKSVFLPGDTDQLADGTIRENIISNTPVEIIFPGQSFVLSTVGYTYNLTLFGAFPGSSLDDGVDRSGQYKLGISRNATYAVRSRWAKTVAEGGNGDEYVQANEVRNYMYICTNCRQPSKASERRGGGMNEYGDRGRQSCKPYSQISQTNFMEVNSGGCSFF